MDLSLLDKAEAQPGEIAALLAQSNGERISNNSDRIIRDKAYAYLKLALDEIRRPIWPSFEKLIYDIGDIHVKDLAQNIACELHFFWRKNAVSILQKVLLKHK